MIGPALMERMVHVPYTFPVLAGAGLSAATLAATDLSGLTQRATAAIGLAGLVGGAIVGAVVFAVTKYDQVKISRQKLYEDANKDSLSKQIEELTAQAAAANAANLMNQERMRESLHQLRSDANVTHLENAGLRGDLETLRTQFMAVSKQLHETDLLLHTARTEFHAVSVELQKTATQLAATATERDTLRTELGVLRRSQVAQGRRIDAMESGGLSGDNLPAVKPSPEAPR